MTAQGETRRKPRLPFPYPEVTMTESMRLSASGIRYLLAMHALEKAESGVRSAELAAALGVSRPSVHNMMNTLQGLGLIDKGSYSSARLTDAGRALAQRYGRCLGAAASLLGEDLPADAGMQSALCALLAEMPEANLDALCARADFPR